MKEKFIEYVGNLADFLMPSHCFACSRAVEKGAVICEECYKQIEKTEEKSCDKCGRSIKTCDCNKYIYHFSGITAPFVNKGIAQKGLYGLKFASDKASAKFYVQHMVDRLESVDTLTDFSCVTFVPMSFLRKIRRGFNQAEILAEGVGKILNIPIRNDLLRRSLISSVQHKNDNLSQRFENAFKSYHRTKA